MRAGHSGKPIVDRIVTLTLLGLLATAAVPAISECFRQPDTHDDTLPTDDNALVDIANED